MSMTAHTYVEIPRLFTGVAEWCACMLFIWFLPKKHGALRTAAAAAAALVLQCLFLILTDDVPLYLWLLCMLTAFGMMYIHMFVQLDLPQITILYYTLLAVVLAELMAAMGWQAARSAGMVLGWNRARNTLITMAVYLIILCVMAAVERRLSHNAQASPYAWPDLIPPMIIVMLTFAISNLGYALKALHIGPGSEADLFNTRTLIDLGGLALLYAIRYRLIGIQAQRDYERIGNILNAQYEKYKAGREAIDMVNMKYHDLKHQIIGLKAEMDPAVRNAAIDEIEQQLEEYKPERQTGSPVLDAILSGKEAQIRALEIAFTCVADGALLSPMHVVDICSIFGNALENAIEHEAIVSEREKRWMHMVLTQKKGFVYVSVSNYCETPVGIRDGLPVTTKKDRELHGYGVRSMVYTAAKYGGSVDFRFEQSEEKFEVRILMPMPLRQRV